MEEIFRNKIKLDYSIINNLIAFYHIFLIYDLENSITLLEYLFTHLRSIQDINTATTVVEVNNYWSNFSVTSKRNKIINVVILFL